jgi:hypothetical protein
MAKPKVYVIKEQVTRGAIGPIVVDYSPAMEYGELVFITRSDMPSYPGSRVQEVWNADVLNFVSEYDENTDFIITTGQPSAIFTVGWVLGRAGKTPKFLMWRREESRYKPLFFNPAMLTGEATTGRLALT